MRWPRFSIASLLAVIGVLGIALAALRNPSYLWANVTFSMALTLLVLAVINAVYGEGARRAYWLGFNLCGWTYLAICSLPGLRESICPRLATEALFDFIYPGLAPPDTQQPPPTRLGRRNPNANQMMMQRQMMTASRQGRGGMGGMMGGMGGGMGGAGGGNVTRAAAPTEPESRWSAWNEPDRTIGIGYPIGTVSLVSSDAYRQIGHSLATLLAAMFGGVYARGRHRARAAREMLHEPRPLPGGESAARVGMT